MKHFSPHLPILTLFSFFVCMQTCAAVFVGAEAGMREYKSGFHEVDRRPGTVSQLLASLVCVITAPFSSRPCFCDVASERLMGWKKTLAQRYGSCSPLCFCLLECAAPHPFLPSLTLSLSPFYCEFMHLSYSVKETFGGHLQHKHLRTCLSILVFPVVKESNWISNQTIKNPVLLYFLPQKNYSESSFHLRICFI